MPEPKPRRITLADEIGERISTLLKSATYHKTEAQRLREQAKRHDELGRNCVDLANEYEQVKP